MGLGIGSELELELGEEVCSECGGRGTIGGQWFNRRLCPVCFGDGKLDWIEKIVGKKPKFRGSCESISSSSMSSSSLSSSC